MNALGKQDAFILLFASYLCEFKDDLEAFEEFCAYREREQERAGEEPITREQWLTDKRRELHSRMRSRRKERYNGRSSFRALL